MRNEFKFLLITITTGFAMWVTAGLWHNLILPTLFPETHAEHEGIFIGLIAYFLLAGAMTYLYPFYSKDNSFRTGIIFGSLIGFMWVFPHSLALAGTHGTSILYEIKNGLYHLVEQGLGGAVLVLTKRSVNESI